MTTIRPELIDELLAEYEKPADLLGDEGLFKQLKKALLERALGAELSEHLGYEKGDPAGRGTGNSRNGYSDKTVLTEDGALDLAVPRDRNGTFEPVIVPALLRTAEYRDAAGFPVDAAGVRLAAPPDESGRAFTFVLSASVLRTWPGSGECMPGQFAHLLAAAGRQGARLGVLPAALTGVPGRAVLPVHGFTLYDDSAVSVETFTRELTLTAEHDVRVYREVFGALERSAVFGREAREMVEHALLEYQKAPTSIH